MFPIMSMSFIYAILLIAVTKNHFILSTNRRQLTIVCKNFFDLSFESQLLKLKCMYVKFRLCSFVEKKCTLIFGSEFDYLN